VASSWSVLTPPASLSGLDRSCPTHFSSPNTYSHAVHRPPHRWGRGFDANFTNWRELGNQFSVFIFRYRVTCRFLSRGILELCKPRLSAGVWLGEFFDIKFGDGVWRLDPGWPCPGVPADRQVRPTLPSQTQSNPVKPIAGRCRLEIRGRSGWPGHKGFGRDARNDPRDAGATLRAGGDLKPVKSVFAALRRDKSAFVKTTARQAGSKKSRLIKVNQGDIMSVKGRVVIKLDSGVLKLSGSPAFLCRGPHNRHVA
jgi:hypothetical protein